MKESLFPLLNPKMQTNNPHCVISTNIVQNIKIKQVILLTITKQIKHMYDIKHESIYPKSDSSS